MREAMMTSRAAIFLALVMCGAGCQGQSTDSGLGEEGERPSASEAAQMEARAAELQALVEVPGPEGWSRAVERGGTRWATPKGDAQVFFGTLRHADEPRATIESLAAAWGVSDIRWADEQSIAIGAERLPAIGADGACKTPAGEGTIAYATADTGHGTLLVAYVFEAGAGPEVREAAMKAVGSFKKR